jgi:predicted ribosome quality control (RQC) complex YloA/Tae2 family protein
MPLHYHEILQLLIEINKALKGSTFSSITELNPKKFILNVTNQEDSPQQLLISLEDPFVRLHLTDLHGVTAKNPFYLKINNLLQAAKVREIKTLNDDRIVQISFSKKGRGFFLIAELYSRNPNCYFTDNQYVIDCSLLDTEKDTYEFPVKSFEKQEEVITGETNSKLIEQRYNEKETRVYFERKRSKLLEQIKKKIRLEIKGQKKFQEQLDFCKKWPEFSHQGVLLQSNLYKITKGMKELVVEDWEQDGKEVTIQLSPIKKPQEIVAEFFKRSRKLKLGIPYIELRLNGINKNLETLFKDRELAHNIQTPEELDAFHSAHHQYKGKKERAAATKKEPVPAPLPYREFIATSGAKIWVGKSASDNELLTFQYANGNDWWLHVHNYSGSHVVIKALKDKPPTEEDLQDAIQLAIAYSKAKDKGEAEVLITQCKYVKRYGKGKKGRVNVSEYKLRYAHFNAKQVELIKNRGNKA